MKGPLARSRFRPELWGSRKNWTICAARPSAVRVHNLTKRPRIADHQALVSLANKLKRIVLSVRAENGRRAVSNGRLLLANNLAGDRRFFVFRYTYLSTTIVPFNNDANFGRRRSGTSVHWRRVIIIITTTIARVRQHTRRVRQAVVPIGRTRATTATFARRPRVGGGVTYARRHRVKSRVPLSVPRRVDWIRGDNIFVYPPLTRRRRSTMPEN